MRRRIWSGVGVAGAMIVLIIAVGVWQYFSWCAQGDVIAFSPRGDLGWGSHPYYMRDRNKEHHRVGTVQSFLFIGHAHIDGNIAGELNVSRQ